MSIYCCYLKTQWFTKKSEFRPTARYPDSSMGYVKSQVIFILFKLDTSLHKVYVWFVYIYVRNSSVITCNALPPTCTRLEWCRPHPSAPGVPGRGRRYSGEKQPTKNCKVSWAPPRIHHPPACPPGHPVSPGRPRWRPAPPPSAEAIQARKREEMGSSHPLLLLSPPHLSLVWRSIIQYNFYLLLFDTCSTTRILTHTRTYTVIWVQLKGENLKRTMYPLPRKLFHLSEVDKYCIKKILLFKTPSGSTTQARISVDTSMGKHLHRRRRRASAGHGCASARYGAVFNKTTTSQAREG